MQTFSASEYLEILSFFQECHYPGGGGKEVSLRALTQLCFVGLWSTLRPPLGNEMTGRDRERKCCKFTQDL